MIIKDGIQRLNMTKKPLRGFGYLIDLKTGLTRKWYINEQGVKCWHDNNKPCNLVEPKV
jgi:hypothetical protein